MVIFLFCFQNCAEIAIFIVFFNINQNLAKKGAKTITFHILQNTGYKKKFCCNPPFDQKLFFFFFFNLCFFETITLMLNKNIIENQQKERQEKGMSKRNQDRKPKKDTGLMKKTFSIEYFDVVTFHETKAKKTEKERKREREGTKKRKKNRKTRRTKEGNNKREREREREREKKKITSGRPTRLRRNKRRHSKKTKNAHF